MDLKMKSMQNMTLELFSGFVWPTREFYLFRLYIYLPDSLESDGGACLCRLEGHPLQVRQNKTRIEGLSFYYLKLLYCPYQKLAVMVFRSIVFCHSKPSDLVLHVVLDVWGTLLECGLRFVRRRRSCNAVKERPHLCMEECNHTTSVRRRLSLTKLFGASLIPTGLHLL